MLDQVREAGRYLRNSLTAALRPNRLDLIRRANDYLEWFASQRLPSRYPRDILPGLGLIKVSVDVDTGHPFELPCGERTILAVLLRFLNAQLVVEIGTYTGTTTRILSDAMGSAGVVHTLDLPPGENVHNTRIGEVVGSAFRNDERYAGRVIQHFGNSRSFDFSPWYAKADLVFVDGSHEKADVLSDSANAFRMVREGGIVVWDDYQPVIRGVVHALHQLGREHDLIHIAETRLVLYQKPCSS
jgi:hypothetical protein